MSLYETVLCHFKMADSMRVDWEEELFRDDASDVSISETDSDDDDQVILLLYIQRTYVILHVRNASVNPRARGHTDARARRKGVTVLLIADAS